MNCYGGHFSVQNNLNLGKINGTKYGPLISKYEGKLWDIDITRGKCPNRPMATCIFFFGKRNLSHAVFLVINIRHPRWKNWNELVENILVFCYCTHFILT